MKAAHKQKDLIHQKTISSMRENFNNETEMRRDKSIKSEKNKSNKKAQWEAWTMDSKKEKKDFQMKKNEK